jgi:hypothetical protein
MTTSTISIEVESGAAQAFAAAASDERRKLELLLSLRLRELTGDRARPLQEIMDEIGASAEAQGLTPEVLNSLLNEP